DRCCDHALVMPNLEPPVRNAEDVQSYHDRLRARFQHKFPLMTFKLLPSTTPEMIREMKGLVAADKLYPAGVTINSEDGFGADVLAWKEGPRLTAFLDAVEEMEKQDLVLSIHAESPDVFCLDREERCILFVRELLSTFSKLRVVVEHLSTHR